MNSQQFYFINLIIFAVLLLYFMFGRSKTKQPTQLNLKAHANEDNNAVKITISEEQAVSAARDVNKYEKLAEAAPKLSHTSNQHGVAVYFVYNGHEWEAYEVLGLPRGSTLVIVTTHYQHLIKTSDPSTFEFYEAAYAAILKSKS